MQETVRTGETVYMDRAGKVITEDEFRKTVNLTGPAPAAKPAAETRPAAEKKEE